MNQHRIRRLAQNPDIIEFADRWQQRLGQRWLDENWVSEIGFRATVRTCLADIIATEGFDCTVDDLLEVVRQLTATSAAA